MQTILIVFFILSFITMIFVFPFKIRFMVHANLVDLKSFYCFKFWRIKLLCGMAEIGQKGEVVIKNSNNLFEGEYDKLFIQNLAKEFWERLDVKKVELFFTGGFVEDSYSSAIVCGTMTSIVQSLYSYLSQKYDDVKMFQDITPTFHETNLELTCDVVVSISCLQVLLSIFGANKLKSRKLEEQNEGK